MPKIIIIPSAIKIPGIDMITSTIDIIITSIPFPKYPAKLPIIVPVITDKDIDRKAIANV